ncbi:hypothetical protein EIN_047720 [Entamoeba invadens IP1]|uniref:Uncharacterized protein n=1 Tax=Entamoeba invadens IP1 TaxID=370355 RepID=A0A0A1UDE2_ENTIV|nr:hypothetical protein EIN_047720 [Entamoeba invadens IP1]ELP94469.1 hypothetical protein EIN_047720 [Entamoeba invadens IP1]|eukprot:XP_004261240.1 hypothetical protein EIN_047720 [Entamoeba invadens IP1]
MGCTLYQMFYHLLVVITLVLAVMTTMTFVLINVPQEYDRAKARNMLNGFNVGDTRCGTPPFNAYHSFSYSYNSAGYKYSCPMGVSNIIKMAISCVLIISIIVGIIYIVLIKKYSNLCIIVVLVCILNTIYSLYCEFFFVHEQIQGHNFCLSMNSIKWENAVNRIECHTFRYTLFTILHTSTIVSMMITGISSSFYIKDYRDEMYASKKLKERQEKNNHKFDKEEKEETYQSDSLVNFEGLVQNSRVKKGDIDFTQLNLN